MPASETAHTPVKVLVLGHSFVRRLQDHLRRSSQPAFGLRPAGHTVHFWGVGGLRFPQLLRGMRVACAPGYDVVLLDFGTNDLAAGCSAELLVDQVLAVTDTLLESYGVKHVIIMEVFPRTDGRYRCPPGFNVEARRYNLLLRERLAACPRTHLHHHKGLVDNWPQYVADGVHLNAAGMMKYTKSVRRAILKYSARRFM